MPQPNPGGWNTVQVAGHACDVYQPLAPSPHDFTVLHLQEASHSQSDLQTLAKEFERHGLRVIGASAGPSWWADHIYPEFDSQRTPEQYVLHDVLPYLAAEHRAQPPRIALFGMGMGGQGALRLAYKYPDLFPVVAAISPALDYQKCHEEGDQALRQMYRDAEAARQDTAILHIHPLNWPRHQWFACDPTDLRWFDSTDRLRMKLWSLGVPFECDLDTSSPAGGMQYGQRMLPLAADFIAERLEQERTRIV